MAWSGTTAQGSPRVLSVFSAAAATLRAMSNPVDPTEPMEPAAGDAEAAPPPPPASPAAPAAAAEPVGHRGGLVTLAWWWLALGALGFLLLGSLLTFVGTKASDDGPDGGRGGRMEAHFGPDQGPMGPGGGGQGPMGPGQMGPGFGQGQGQAPQFGPPEQGTPDGPSDRGIDDDDQGIQDDGSSDTIDTTDSSN